MNIEEVKKFLLENSDGKKLLGELVEDHDSITGLKSKNADLIASNKKLKKERDDSISKVNDLETQLEEAGKGGEDIEAAVAKATKKLQKELDDERSSKSEISSKMQKMIIDNSLNEALLKANIAKNHIPAVRALLRSENTIDIDETDNVAKIKDKDLSSFVTEWAQTDIGKNYVAASQNNGGGASGSSGKTSSVSGEDIMKMDPKQRMILGRKQTDKK